MDKSTLRKKIKSLLENHKGNLSAQSEEVCKKILSSSVYKNASSVFAYMALPDEVCLMALIKEAMKDGKKVWLPRIISGTSNMDFYPLEVGSEIESQVSDGSFQILEPVADEKKKFRIPRVDAEKKLETPLAGGECMCDGTDKSGRGVSGIALENILILVPGRAFTKSGKRLGRGKGFYDFYLSCLKKNYPDTHKLIFAGVCFDFQLVEENELEVSEYDVPMDMVFFPIGE